MVVGVVALQGCIGSWAVDAHLFDRDSREGMTMIVSDEAFAIFAFEGSLGAQQAGEAQDFLRQILGHYTVMSGHRPARRFTFYLHPPDHFTQEGDNYMPVGGLAWHDDFSADILAPPTPIASTPAAAS